MRAGEIFGTIVKIVKRLWEWYINVRTEVMKWMEVGLHINCFFFVNKTGTVLLALQACAFRLELL